MISLYDEARSHMDTNTIPELDRYPKEHWPYYLDEEFDHHVNYYSTNGYSIVEVQSVRPGKFQTEFVGSFVLEDYAQIACRLLNTYAKNEFYDNQKRLKEKE